MVVRHGRNFQPVSQCSDVIRGRHLDQDFAQAQSVLSGSSPSAAPHVHRHVVVVPAGRYEQRLPVPARRPLKTQRVHIKILGGLHVPYLKVHVPDAGCGFPLASHGAVAAA